MRVVLMHGKDTDPSKKWYPWLAQEMKARGIDFAAPVLPSPGNPHVAAWLAVLEMTRPDEDTVLIGHSRGGVTILRWLERLPAGKRVRKVILVAVNSGRLQDKAIPEESNHGFYTEAGYDCVAIKQHCADFVVLHSRDDQWVPFSAGEYNAQALGAEFVALDGRGHFGKDVDAIQELLAEIVDIF